MASLSRSRQTKPWDSHHLCDDHFFWWMAVGNETVRCDGAHDGHDGRDDHDDDGFPGQGCRIAPDGPPVGCPPSGDHSETGSASGSAHDGVWRNNADHAEDSGDVGQSHAPDENGCDQFRLGTHPSKERKRERG